MFLERKFLWVIRAQKVSKIKFLVFWQISFPFLYIFLIEYESTNDLLGWLKLNLTLLLDQLRLA